MRNARLIAFILFFLIGTGLVCGLVSCKKQETVEAVNEDYSAATMGPYEDRVTILFGGDTGFGESYGKRIRRMLKDKGYAYSLAKLKPIMMASDFTILNMETPITNLKKSPFSKKLKTYIHWSDPIKAPRQLKKHRVKVVSLANNHTLDYGMGGLKQTFEVLQKHDIQWIGAGRNTMEARKPFVAELKIKGQTFRLAVLAGFEYSQKYDKVFHFYAKGKKGGANRFSVKRTAQQIAKLREKYPGIYIVAFPHWGGNYAWRNKKQAQYGRELIDAGADLVIGHGGHRFQEIEKHNDHWILYGLGNFMFNSPGRYKKLKSPPYSLAAQLIVQESEGKLVKSMRIYPIFSDNKITKYQPRLLSNEEFAELYKILLNRSTNAEQFENDVRTDEDEIGRYLEFSLE
ncbi:MAG: CapA family protein [Alphaproteobacteria bacterium]